MAVYAAQIEAMDRGVGQIIDSLERTGKLEDTILAFLSDNGASSERLPQVTMEHFRANTTQVPPTDRLGNAMKVGITPDIMPGPADTNLSHGPAWANVSNAPFRPYKKWVHEGGIAAPFLVRWPAAGLRAGTVVDRPHQLVDVLPTLLDACKIEQDPADTADGASMLPELRGQANKQSAILYWEPVGNAAVRKDTWKLVRERDQDWELYDLRLYSTELLDLTSQHPETTVRLQRLWSEWARDVGVIPWSITAQHDLSSGRTLEEGGG